MPYSSNPRIKAIEIRRDALISLNSSTGSGTSERFKRARAFPQALSQRLSGDALDEATRTKLQDGWNIWMTNSAFRQLADAVIADPSKTAEDLVYPETVSSPLPSIYTGTGIPFVTPEVLTAALEPLQEEMTALSNAGATDAELTAAVAALTSSIALKQDAATAATDAELSAALSTASTDATAKADAAKAFAIQRANHTGTQASGTIVGLGTAAVLPSTTWQPAPVVLVRERTVRVLKSLVNVAAIADAAIWTGLPTKYRIEALYAFDASSALTSVVKISLHSGAGATGTTIVNSLQMGLGLGLIKDYTIVSGVLAAPQTFPSLYLRVDVALGIPATCSFMLVLTDLST